MNPPVSDYTAFYDREFARIALLAGTTCGSMTRGEDIAQEALTQAAKKWHDVSSYDRPGAWLRRVAINLALNDRRRSRTEGRAMQRVGEPPPVPPVDARMGDPSVWSAVDALPPRQRAVVILHYVDDLPVIEIGDILEISVSATTSHLHAARTALAASLDDPRTER